MARLLLRPIYIHIWLTVRHQTDHKGWTTSSTRGKCYWLYNAICKTSINVPWAKNNTLWMEYWWIYSHLGCYELSIYSKLGNSYYYNLTSIKLITTTTFIVGIRCYIRWYTSISHYDNTCIERISATCYQIIF